MSELETLVERLRARISDPEQLRLARLVITDSAYLTSGIAAGKPIAQAEFAHVAAQAANLTAASAEHVRTTLTEWTSALVGKVLDQVLPG